MAAVQILGFNNASITGTRHFLHITSVLRDGTERKRITAILSTPTGVAGRLITVVRGAVDNRSTLPGVDSTRHVFTRLLAKLTTTRPKFPLTRLGAFISRRFTRVGRILRNVDLLKRYPSDVGTTLVYHNRGVSVTVVTNILRTHNRGIAIVSPIRGLLTIKRCLRSAISVTRSAHHVTTDHVPTSRVILVTNFATNGRGNRLIILKHGNSSCSTTILTTYLHTSYYRV